MTLKLNPKNDLAFVATIKLANDAGVLTPLTTGSGEAFLATSNDSEATAADASLVGEVLYTGKPGKWLVRFDGSILDSTLLATLFATTTPWCIVQFPNDIRVAVELAYEDAKVVTVVSA
jgi:hypothetical protein